VGDQIGCPESKCCADKAQNSPFGDLSHASLLTSGEDRYGIADDAPEAKSKQDEVESQNKMLLLEDDIDGYAPTSLQDTTDFPFHAKVRSL
jgi:hypothetical protein